MNITRENVDELNVVLKIKVEPLDYEVRVGNVLNDYRKKVRMDGFRPGKVPPGLIRKMYRKPVLIEEVNKLISENISKFLVDEKLRILGEPLPSESQTQTIDWDTQTDFEFSFDLGLAPEFILSLSQKDKITQYEINVDQKLKDSYLEGAIRRFGSFKTIETVEENAYLKGRMEQVNSNGNPMEGGVANDEMSLYLPLIKDEEIRTSFLGKKAGDVVVVDIKKSFPNDTEIASMLNIKKEQVENLTPLFRFSIKVISRFENAAINQELFDKIYGKDKVTSEEEFMKKLEEEITANLNRESEYRFQMDVREALINKFNPQLPVSFLKRWLFTINEGKYTTDQIEHDFEHFEKDLKWQLIRDKIVIENDIKVTDEEIFEMAKQITISQFMQYGITNFPADQVEGYARDLLKREEDKKRIIERKLEEKVYTFIRSTMNVEQKSISSEEFNKLFEKDKKPTHHHHEHE
jgi:trigger factor